MLKILLVLVVAVAFVLVTAGSLPPTVASHFAAGGAANGFMPRAVYVKFMLGLVVALPLLMSVLMGITGRIPVRYINLPNRDYWLAPARVDETLAYLRGQGGTMGVLLCTFLCFVHWLVVRANGLTPAQFPETQLFVGVAVFALALVLWIGRFVRHFARPH